MKTKEENNRDIASIDYSGGSIALLIRGNYSIYASEALIRAPLRSSKIIVVWHNEQDVSDYADRLRLLLKGVEFYVITSRDFHLINEIIHRSSLVIAVGWKWLEDASHSNIMVFHDSLLPKYRGHNPLVTALINGDAQIGVTAFWADQDIDTGPIVYQKSIDFSYPIAIKEAIKLIGGLYVEIIEQIIEDFAKKQIPKGVTQSEDGACYSLWRNEEDYFINWGKSADYIERHINASSSPYGYTKSLLDSKVVMIKSGQVVRDIVVANRIPGKVIRINDNKCPVVVCGEGLIELTDVCDDAGNSLIPFKKLRSQFKNV